MTTIQKIKEKMKQRQITEEVMDYNGLNRDTQRFAIKCSSITRPNGTEQDVFKDPITDPGKKSKKGKVTTYYNKESKTYFVDRVGMDFETSYEILEVVYENGELIKEVSLEDIRNISK